MKRLKCSLVVLLILSNLFFPSEFVLSNQISQARIPDEYAPKLQLFEINWTRESSG